MKHAAVALAAALAFATPAAADPCDSYPEEYDEEVYGPVVLPDPAIEAPVVQFAGLDGAGALSLRDGKLLHLRPSRHKARRLDVGNGGRPIEAMAVAGRDGAGAWTQTAGGRTTVFLGRRRAGGSAARTWSFALPADPGAGILRVLAGGNSTALVRDLRAGGIVVHRPAAPAVLEDGVALGERGILAIDVSDAGVVALVRSGPRSVDVRRLAPGSTAWETGGRVRVARRSAVLAAGVTAAGTLRAVLREPAGGGRRRLRVLTVPATEKPALRAFAPRVRGGAFVAAVQGRRVAAVTRTARGFFVLRPGRKPVRLGGTDVLNMGLPRLALSASGDLALAYGRDRQMREVWAARLLARARRPERTVRVAEGDEGENENAATVGVAIDGRGRAFVRFHITDTCGDPYADQHSVVLRGRARAIGT